MIDIITANHIVHRALIKRHRMRLSLKLYTWLWEKPSGPLIINMRHPVMFRYMKKELNYRHKAKISLVKSKYCVMFIYVENKEVE